VVTSGAIDHHDHPAAYLEELADRVGRSPEGVRMLPVGSSDNDSGGSTEATTARRAWSLRRRTWRATDRATIAELRDLLPGRLEAINARVADGARPVAVTGQLFALPPARRNGVIYEARLTDPLAPAESVLLDVRASMLEGKGVQEGDVITAHGPIVSNFLMGRLTLRVRADRVVLAELPKARERRLAELPLLEAVRRAGGLWRPLPHFMVTHGSVAVLWRFRVRADFLAALGPRRQELQIRELEISMFSPLVPAAAIRERRRT
jgi:hypothetical protein